MRVPPRYLGGYSGYSIQLVAAALLLYNREQGPLVPMVAIQTQSYMGKAKAVWTMPRAMLGYAVALLSVTATLLVARLQFILQAAPVSLFLFTIMFNARVWGIKLGLHSLVLYMVSF